MKPKEIIGWVAVVAIIALLLWLVLDKCNGSADGKGEAPDSITYWKNEAGAAVASLKAAQSDFAITEQNLLDSIAKVYNTNTRYIKEYVTVMVEGNVDVPPADTFYVYSDNPFFVPEGIYSQQRFKSPYYDAFVQIGDSSYMHLKTYDTITYVWKDVIENNKKYVQLDISFADTSRKVTGLQAFRKEIPKTKPRKIGVGLQLGIGGGADLKSRKFFMGPYVGIGVSYNFIRL